MKSIRTKLIIALLLITLFPIVPIYYLVKGLLQQSLEVGYNENVATALESASSLARDLYGKFKQETLSLTEDLSARSEIKAVFETRLVSSGIDSLVAKHAPLRLDFFDPAGALLNSAKVGSMPNAPQIYRNDVDPLLEHEKANLLDAIGGNAFIVAFAPVRRGQQRLGTLILTRGVDETFSKRANSVVNVYQLFKTLDFFGDLSEGFLLSFLAIYIPLAIASVSLFIYFSRKITSPLLALVEGTKVVAAGDWSFRMPVRSQDEIGQLSAAFNNMLVSLKEKQEQVISLEKMAAWRELARVLAHEIKNPLTPIQLTVQQMKDQYGGEDPVYARLIDECTDIINDEVESLCKLVREFSDFARMPRLNLSAGSLNELIEDVARLYASEPFQIHLDANLPEFNFDSDKMRQVLINLVQNGLDSIREKGSGEIQIETVSRDRVVELIYRDTGNGVPDDIRDKIFEPYFSTKKNGMGLGLAVVKRIIEEHGGTISLQSEAAVGTTFVLRFEREVENRLSESVA